MEKLFISLATCELLSIWSDADSAPDKINCCIDGVATWGTGPWTGITQLRDEVSDWNAFSRVRSHPLRQEIFCRPEILDVLIRTLMYGQFTPKSVSPHPINMGLKVLTVTELPRRTWRCCLSCFHTVVLSIRWNIGSLQHRTVQLMGSFDRVSLPGVTGNSRTWELPWVVLPEPWQPFALLAMRKGSCNCCSSPNLFNACVTFSSFSLSEVALKTSTANPEKTMV